MTEDSLTSRIRMAAINWRGVNKIPTEFDEWGCFVYADDVFEGDTPLAEDSAIEFLWFRNRNLMLEFIASTLPYFPVRPQVADPNATAQATAEVVGKMTAGLVPDSEGMEQLNKVLPTGVRLFWIGTVADLLAGDHPFAVEVRRVTRNRQLGESDGGPVRDDEKNEFFDCLSFFNLFWEDMDFESHDAGGRQD